MCHLKRGKWAWPIALKSWAVSKVILGSHQRTHCGAQGLPPCLRWGSPPKWVSSEGLGDDANLGLFLSPSMQSAGDRSVHATNPGPGKCPGPTVQTWDLGDRSCPGTKELSLSKYFIIPPWRSIKTSYPFLRCTTGLWSSLQIMFLKGLTTMSRGLLNFRGTTGLHPQLRLAPRLLSESQIQIFSQVPSPCWFQHLRPFAP